MCTSLSAAPANSALCQYSGTSQPESCTYKGGVKLQGTLMMDWVGPRHGTSHRLGRLSGFKNKKLYQQFIYMELEQTVEGKKLKTRKKMAKE